MALPIMATVDDIDDLVSYLKTKSAGSSIADAKKVLRKQILDRRKIPAYVQWGIVKREDQILKLDARGWELARNSRPRHNVFQDIIRSIKPYYSALEWAYHNSFDEITSTDVGSHWHEHFSDELGTDDEKGIKTKVACFFGICDAANLGSYTIGRRGQPTRLSLSRDNLELFIGVGGIGESGDPEGNSDRGSTPTQDDDDISDRGDDQVQEESNESADRADDDRSDQDEPRLDQKNDEVKVFISHGKNMELVEQVETMLGVAEVPYEIAVTEESSAIPVPEKIFNSMRRCNAAVIIVSAEEAEEEGPVQINQNVLIEIGAAFVLYNKKVILLWDNRLEVPSNLQGLYRSEFEGDELSWKSGMKLMKAIKDFRGA